MTKKVLYFIFLSSVCFALSVDLFEQWYSKGGVPEAEELETFQGVILKVWKTGKHRNTTRFTVQGIDRHFVYSSISEEVDKFQGYARAGEIIEIAYSTRQSHSPIFDENEYHTVYSVSFPGKWERNYDQIKDRHETNAQYSILLALLFLAFPIYLFIKLRGNWHNK